MYETSMVITDAEADAGAHFRHWCWGCFRLVGSSYGCLCHQVDGWAHGGRGGGPYTVVKIKKRGARLSAPPPPRDDDPDYAAQLAAWQVMILERRAQRRGLLR
jgi:hypothetical protein